MSTCRSTFDRLGPNPRPTDLRGTHTCELDHGHAPPHVCPRCGTRWISEPGQRQNRVLDATTPPEVYTVVDDDPEPDPRGYSPCDGDEIPTPSE